MAERDPLVLSYVHLSGFPRADAALNTLKKVASLVKPIMRARGWTVNELAEFYPEQPNLLGINVNKGMKICLRLRYPTDRNQFMPMESVIDTMLHELAHNVHSSHDSHFHALWDQLRDEHQGLIYKGYTGEGFLSEGQRLGGQRMPLREVRRLAREAAEKRHASAVRTGPGRRLGGAAPRADQDIRQVIVKAIERRNKTLRGCATDKLSDKEIRIIADTATRNGSRTQAEEDEANEAAIAQALWELVQEDEQVKYGQSYIPPTAENPTGNGGGSVMGTKPGPSQPVAQGNSVLAPATATDTDKHPDTESGMWACEKCTLHNPTKFLSCEVCGAEKPDVPPAVPSDSSRPPPTTIDLTKDSGPPSRTSKAKIPQKPAPPAPQTWFCRFCGTEMERKWWTCVNCGLMKDSSR